jgi:hypothetical protein
MKRCCDLEPGHFGACKVLAYIPMEPKADAVETFCSTDAASRPPGIDDSDVMEKGTPDKEAQMARKKDRSVRRRWKAGWKSQKEKGGGRG